MSSISIVIPAFNAEATLFETVSSVLQQSWKDFELLVINPSSSDATAHILSQFKDPRLQIIDRPCGNVAVNRNYGLSLATGEFITFLDADDLWTPSKLEAQHRQLRENPWAAVCYSWTDCIDEQGNRLYPASHDSWAGDVYEHLLQSNFVASGSNFMVRTAALRNIGGFDETLTNCHDLDICLRLAERYQFVPVPEVQVLYRICESSLSANFENLERSNLLILQRSYEHPKGLSHQSLKPKSYGNLYQYLAWKALREWDPRVGRAILYLGTALRWDPKTVLSKDFFRLLLRIAVSSLLPVGLNSRLCRWLRERRSRRYRRSLQASLAQSHRDLAPVLSMGICGDHPDRPLSKTAVEQNSQ